MAVALQFGAAWEKETALYENLKKEAKEAAKAINDKNNGDSKQTAVARKVTAKRRGG